MRCNTQMTKFLRCRPCLKQGIFHGWWMQMHTEHMLQTDCNATALSRTTQGMSLDIYSTPMVLILKCTSPMH